MTTFLMISLSALTSTQLRFGGWNFQHLLREWLQALDVFLIEFVIELHDLQERLSSCVVPQIIFVRALGSAFLK